MSENVDVLMAAIRATHPERYRGLADKVRARQKFRAAVQLLEKALTDGQPHGQEAGIGSEHPAERAAPPG
ncbi:MAG: hypothetical protein HQM03_13060 [Magnetococcales bacterium]|nr:hypothetical protein [Magnetococcales bacterium]